MSLSFGMSQRQVQALRLSSTLQQSLQILQYGQSELFEHIQALCSANPMVEWVSPPAARLKARRNREALGRDDQWASTMDFQPQALSIVDHLGMQLTLCPVDTHTKQAIQYMIGSLDDSGYLVESVDAVASALSIDVDVVESALNLFQTFDPPGIGARDLRECLLAQIDTIQESVCPLARSLIDEYLEDVASKRWEWLSHHLNVPPEDILAAVGAIRRLQPRPAFGYDTGTQEPIEPDVILDSIDGKWLPRPNLSACPRIRVVAPPTALGEPSNETASRWYRERVSEAEQVMGMLERRTHTLLRIAVIISHTQQEFFENGVYGLKPLTLKDVSIRSGYHVSTVSRAVQSKFIATPRGVYPFRYFFSSEVSGAETEGVSSKVVRAHVKEWVQKEDPHRPWSDEDLRRRCLDIGITVSRRTIAKYRKELRIPSSKQRRDARPTSLSP